MPRERGRHGREHDVRDAGAVLVRGLHRHGSGDGVAARREGACGIGVVEEMNVEAVEEGWGMRLFARGAERSDRQ